MIQISIRKKGFSVRKIREFGFIFKRGLVAMAKRWRDEMLPGHFKRGAGNKYKYQKRTAAYQKRKDRRGLPPMVYSGKAKRQILSHRGEPKGSQKMIKLKLPSPGFFGRKYRRWNHTMADEVRKMTKSEVTKLGNEALENIERLMNEESRQETLLFR